MTADFIEKSPTEHFHRLYTEKTKYKGNGLIRDSDQVIFL